MSCVKAPSLQCPTIARPPRPLLARAVLKPKKPITIGKVVSGNSGYILVPGGSEQVVKGQAGELVISGVGVTHGNLI